MFFYIKDYKNPITGENKADKICTTSNDNNYIMAELLSDYDNLIKLDSEIIKNIDDVLSGAVNEARTGSQSGTAVFIKSDLTKFIYFNNNSSYLKPDLIVPTNDFKQIAIEWKEFLNNLLILKKN